MENKKTKIFGLVLIAAVLLFAAYLYMSDQNNSYSIAVKANWGIGLPYGGKIIYEKELPEVSFNGDGERYRVYRYDDEPAFDEDITWSDKLAKGNRLLEIAENMQADYMPDLESGVNRYFHMTGDDDARDKLWIIYDTENMMLYVVEDFY